LPRTRTYTHRKDQLVPYESGSIMDDDAKNQSKAKRNFEESLSKG
jgi:hypothetical protein